MITGASQGDSNSLGSLLNISKFIVFKWIETADKGVLIFSDLDFHSNIAESSIIEISKSVGNLTFKNCKFENEVLHSGTEYIHIENPFVLILDNITFTGITDDNSTSFDDTTLIYIDSIDVESIQSLTHIVKVSNIFMENSTVSFIHLVSFSGRTTTKKYIVFDQTTIKDAVFEKYNDLIIFGPLYTEDNIDIYFSHWTFDNLRFRSLVNIIHLKYQTINPFQIEHCTFTNIIGGRILVEPLTISSTSVYSQFSLTNVSVSNNDFRDSTFIVLKEHCKLIIHNSDIFRNSASFRGTVLSITESNSQINISDWSFNNNNGLHGGLFFVSGNSPIYVTNSSFFKNFALTATISFTTKQGNVHFINCNFTFNHALSIGLFETIDSSVASSIEHWDIHHNEIVQKSIILTELDDRTHCLNLWFASDSYYENLKNNRNLIDFLVKPQ